MTRKKKTDHHGFDRREYEDHDMRTSVVLAKLELASEIYQAKVENIEKRLAKWEEDMEQGK